MAVFEFFKDLFSEKKLLLDLAINDCRARFAASGLGIIWAFLQPLLTILVFWFVFQVGFKNPPIENVQFMVWFVPAFLIWNYFSEGLLQTTNSLLEYSYLIKKVNFRVDIIPPIKIISAGIIHLAFVLFIYFIMLVYKQPITWYSLQFIYYFFCTVVLVLGLGWLTSALNAFVKDVGNIVGVIIQIGFWATPIFWNPLSLNENILGILRINPMFYICEGYRDAFIYDVWFWEKPGNTLYFWCITIILLIVGAHMYKKLKPLFADVL